MRRPKLGQYKYANKSLLPTAYLVNQNKYIDQEEEKKKERIEVLEKIRDLTESLPDTFSQEINKLSKTVL